MFGLHAKQQPPNVYKKIKYIKSYKFYFKQKEKCILSLLVSWISFLIPPDIVPGRMTLLITVFLVLVNIFNTITTNIPKVMRI